MKYYMNSGRRRGELVLMVAVGVALAASTAQAQYYINEIFFNPGNSGSDDFRDEYIELRGPASGSLDDFYLLILENELPGGLGDSAGVVERIFNLNTRALGSNGFLVFLQKGSLYQPNPASTILKNEGTGNGYGSGPGSSTIGALSNGDFDLEGGGFTAMLIENVSGFAPTLDMALDGLIDNDGDLSSSDKDGLDYPETGQPGWVIHDSVGVFGEADASEEGRLYGRVNYVAVDEFTSPGLAPLIEPGTEWMEIDYEVEYIGRYGNSTGNDLRDWHISNFTNNGASGSLGGYFAAGGPDLRQSCRDLPGCHPNNDFDDDTAPDQPEGGTESNHNIPYGTKMTRNVGSPNFIMGDYNKDGEVDAADYTVWRNTFGAIGNELNHPPADGNHDFVVNDADYNIWRQNYGSPNNRYVSPGGGGVAANVPEPSSAGIMGAAIALLAGAWRRRSV